MNAQLREAPLFSFAREYIDEVLAEIRPLLKAHFAEIAHFKDIPLDPDWYRYRRMEEADVLRIFTVRDDRENLVGYAIFTVGTAIHYHGSVQAMQDVIYIAPEFRRGRLGWRLIRYCDDQLKREGVELVRHHVKAAHNFGPLLERLGYELEDHIFVRKL